VKYLLGSLAFIAVLLGSSPGPLAQSEITLLMQGPVGRDLVPKIVAGFEIKTGKKVKITFAQGTLPRPVSRKVQNRKACSLPSGRRGYDPATTLPGRNCRWIL